MSGRQTLHKRGIAGKNHGRLDQMEKKRKATRGDIPHESLDVIVHSASDCITLVLCSLQHSSL